LQACNDDGEELAHTETPTVADTEPEFPTPTPSEPTQEDLLAVAGQLPLYPGAEPLGEQPVITYDDGLAAYLYFVPAGAADIFDFYAQALESTWQSEGDPTYDNSIFGREVAQWSFTKDTFRLRVLLDMTSKDAPDGITKAELLVQPIWWPVGPTIIMTPGPENSPILIGGDPTP
jgi:hypothetical protein